LTHRFFLPRRQTEIWSAVEARLRADVLRKPVRRSMAARWGSMDQTRGRRKTVSGSLI
jgi:hypothetical protein